MSGLTGRFLSRDPIGYEGRSLLYGASFLFVGMDPLGLFEVDPVKPIKTNPKKTNCAGYAFDYDDGTAVYPTESLYNMAASLGFECFPGVGALDCKSKGLESGCVQGYIYAVFEWGSDFAIRPPHPSPLPRGRGRGDKRSVAVESGVAWQ